MPKERGVGNKPKEMKKQDPKFLEKLALQIGQSSKV